MASEITVDKVEKSFGATRALDGVSLSVKHGELFGLIGPDGAGKTTLIRVLVGLMRPDAGSASVGGHDTIREQGKLREMIGYLSQRFSLYPDLTVRENIRFYADLFQIDKDQVAKREQELLGFSRLAEFVNRRAGDLSGGMKQKLALCCALIHVPRVLFLDEPTTGVDPVSRREFWDLLAELRGGGTTVFVTTAYMDEAARCGRVALMYGGKLLAVDTPSAIPKLYPCALLEVRLPEAVTQVERIEAIEGVRSVQVFGDRLHVGVEDSERTGEDIRRALDGGVEIAAIAPGLEDVFVEMIR